MDERAVLQDADLQAHYDLMFKLFADPAWARFVEEAQRFRDGVNDIRRLRTEHALGFAQGQVDVLDWIENFATMTRKAHEILLEQDNPAQPAPAEAATDVDDLL